MCNDEALNVVISTIKANIHVFVHMDLHEIYLLNVNIELDFAAISHKFWLPCGCTRRWHAWTAWACMIWT
jgi:hypothetical protein